MNTSNFSWIIYLFAVMMTVAPTAATSAITGTVTSSSTLTASSSLGKQTLQQHKRENAKLNRLKRKQY